MRKITLLGIVSSAALLSACATSPKAPAPQSTDASVTAMSTPASVTSNSSSLPSSTVKLSAKDGRLVAKIYTDWNGAKQGDLKLHWVAPSQSHCVSTTFPIMKYKEASDYSWAYRTLAHQSANGSISCPGVWKAEVVYTPTKAVVGQAELNVSQ
ncbi:MULTISPECIES: TUL4 family lipoprotein [Cysteiniphilum]|uniref:TUL4 family lipoprotein n=1 Tax=Cysteiniphilum TaxID=2056696 RepID=UPI001784006D|nr:MULTISPECIES: TUL4 family lipoprotein [Cysteiniphilum]